jgi:hypothetical protein
VQPTTKSVNAQVSPVDSENPNGEFELVLSDSSLDRDGEQLMPGDWQQPLPERLHFDSDHAFSKGMSVPLTVGSGKPRIDKTGRLVVKGAFAGTKHGQLVRQLVKEGHVWQASVTYLTHKSGKRELLNGTFTGVPSNPRAVVLASKSLKGAKMNLDHITSVKELEAEFAAKVFRGGLTEDEADVYDKRWKELEQKDVLAQNRAAAGRLAGISDSAEYHARQQPYDSFAAPQLTEQYEHPGIARRKWIAPSPLCLTTDQLQQLHASGRHKTPYSVTANAPGFDAERLPSESKIWTGKDMASHSNLHLKWTTPDSAAEGTPGSLLPPELLSTAFPLRIEPVRLFEFFPGAAAGGQAVSFLQHISNGNSAAAVAELTQKPDLAPDIDVTTVSFTTIAAMLSVSRQFFDDYPTWSNFAPAELYRAIVDEENAQILTGNGDSPNMLGLLNAPNTLTRVANLGGSGATSVTEIDVLRSAVMDLRQGPEYCVADLIVLSVQDWDFVQKLKNSLGSYILDASTPNTIGGIDNIMGTRVVSTTKMPQGTALVMDTRIACLAWTRLGMEILSNQFDSYSWEYNAWSFRGEERISVGIQYPKAINIVTGLNPGHGS